VTDYIVELQDASGTTILSGSISDYTGNLGVYKITFTPTLSGTYYLVIKFNGLSVDASPYSITVNPKAITSAAMSSISSVSLAYTAGDTMEFLIYAHDIYGNLRPLSIAEVFVVILTESTSGSSYTCTTTSNSNGTYTVTH
jgi:hypothetical protein